MWAVGIVSLGLFGIVLISLFGNITVTNQQNYTLMKNSVEAAMYDSIDVFHYRMGFCLCTDKEKEDGKWQFTSNDDYTITDLVDNTCPLKAGTKCEVVSGGIKLNKEIFTESLIRRFTESTKGNKNYQIIVQDVIEYPPKVSVEIKSYDNFNLFSSSTSTFDDEDFSISNQIDSILESKGE